jgi:type I restriction enzyme S subunit
MTSSVLTDFEFAPFDIIDGDRGKNYPKQNEFASEGHCLFLSATNVTKSGFDFSDCQFISEQKDAALRKGKLRRDDVVLTTRGTIGNSAYYSDVVQYEHMRINSGMVILRCDTENILPVYLYHFLRSPSFFGQVNSLRSGVAQPQLPIRDMKKIKLPLPSIKVQSQISSVLSAYDDLIENNRRRIQLLEQAARLLYKEWFVHLRFPGHEHTQIIDGVPEGWEKKVLGDVCFEVRETVSPSALEADTPYIGLEHMPRRSITLCEWGQAEQVTSSKHRFREGEILFGKIRPYFHKVGIALTDGVASSDAIIIRPVHSHLLPLVLMTTSSDGFVAVTAQQMKEGSKMPRADWKQMQQYPVPLPPDGLLRSFNDIIDPILNQLKTLAFANKRLGAARDLLLPKLMNGEVAV